MTMLLDLEAEVDVDSRDDPSALLVRACAWAW